MHNYRARLDPDMMSVTDAAKKLGVNNNDIYYWCACDLIKYERYKFSGDESDKYARYIIPVSEVESIRNRTHENIEKMKGYHKVIVKEEINASKRI